MHCHDNEDQGRYLSYHCIVPQWIRSVTHRQISVLLPFLFSTSLSFFNTPQHIQQFQQNSTRTPIINQKDSLVHHQQQTNHYQDDVLHSRNRLRRLIQREARMRRWLHRVLQFLAFHYRQNHPRDVGV